MSTKYGFVAIVGRPLKSGEWYKRVKREMRADPRVYDDHPRFPAKKMAAMYGIDASTYRRYQREIKKAVSGLRCGQVDE